MQQKTYIMGYSIYKPRSLLIRSSALNHATILYDGYNNDSCVRLRFL